jgi:uncharacterized membrane protein
MSMKDRVIFILAAGLILMLLVIILGDFYVAIVEMRPVDESIIELLKMAITGIVGIIAGYVSGKSG